MRIFSALLLLLHTLAVFRPASGAAVDRYDTDRPQRHTAVINFMDTTKDRRTEEEEERRSATTVEYSQEGDEEEYDYDEYYDEEEYEYDMSGDDSLDLPRVAMVSKPKDSSAILEAENTEGKRRGNGRKRTRGKGKKRNPCLKKYKDFCIHGTCQYLKELRAPSCVCSPNYSGERCEFITLLPVQSPEGYSRTTALAVVAVVLSSVCLTIIVLLLMLRFHKRGAYDVENEEKVKLGLASNH